MALRDLLLISLLFFGPACDEEDTGEVSNVDSDGDSDVDSDMDTCLNEDVPAIYPTRLERFSPVPHPAEVHASGWTELEELAPGAGAWVI